MKNIFNPTIFSCYGQATSIRCGKLCLCITLRDMIHAYPYPYSLFHECTLRLSEDLFASLLYRASRSFPYQADV